MKDISTIPTLAQPASSLALPIQLAQQAADAVRELLAEVNRPAFRGGSNS